MKGFFAAIPFSEFIRHFRKMTIEEAGDDVMKSMDDIEELKEDGKSFGSLMVRLMNERIASNSEKNRINGSKGGRPRKNSPDTRGGSASPAGCAAGKRIPPQESTTAAGESAEKPAPPDIGGSAASAGITDNPRAGEVSDSPEVSESSDAANRCFASPAGCASGKRIPPQESTTAAGESAAPLECGLNGGSAERAGGFYGPLPPTTAELYDFAEAARLNEADAREWWELCTERGWKDRSGKPIRDWKKACERYCARRAINRMANGET